MKVFLKNSKSKRAKFKLTLIVIGLVVVLGSAGFLIYNYVVGVENQEESKKSDDGEVKAVRTCRDDLNGRSQLFTANSINREWYLIGKEISEDKNKINLKAEISEDILNTIPEDSEIIVSYNIVGTNVSGDMEPVSQSIQDNDLTYSASIDVTNLEPGTYHVLMHTDTECGQFTSRGLEFKVSYPVYVAWTLDWEGYDVENKNLDSVSEISEDHGDIPITHFWNPRLYTNPTISEDRQDELTDWVQTRVEENEDSIGLHTHMFPDMVKAAGVEPKEDPVQWGSTLKDGYDILTSEYDYEETLKILEWSKDVFAEKGFEEPTMYRAGGWYADEENLAAVNDAGFVLDSSGRTSYSYGVDNVEGHWYLESTTQPYQLNRYNQNNTQNGNMNLWEFPNNGADSWSFSGDQMYKRYRDNYSGGVSDDRVLVTFLSHPEWFDTDKPKLHKLFGSIETELNSTDSGPVIYITLDEAYEIWASE